MKGIPLIFFTIFGGVEVGVRTCKKYVHSQCNQNPDQSMFARREMLTIIKFNVYGKTKLKENCRQKLTYKKMFALKSFLHKYSPLT